MIEFAVCQVTVIRRPALLISDCLNLHHHFDRLGKVSNVPTRILSLFLYLRWTLAMSERACPLGEVFAASPVPALLLGDIPLWLRGPCIV